MLGAGKFLPQCRSPTATRRLPDQSPPPWPLPVPGAPRSRGPLPRPRLPEGPQRAALPAPGASRLGASRRLCPQSGAPWAPRQCCKADSQLLLVVDLDALHGAGGGVGDVELRAQGGGRKRSKNRDGRAARASSPPPLPLRAPRGTSASASPSWWKVTLTKAPGGLPLRPWCREGAEGFTARKERCAPIRLCRRGPASAWPGPAAPSCSSAACRLRGLGPQRPHAPGEACLGRQGVCSRRTRCVGRECALGVSLPAREAFGGSRRLAAVRPAGGGAVPCRLRKQLGQLHSRKGRVSAHRQRCAQRRRSNANITSGGSRSLHAPRTVGNGRGCCPRPQRPVPDTGQAIAGHTGAQSSAAGGTGHHRAGRLGPRGWRGLASSKPRGRRPMRGRRASARVARRGPSGVEPRFVRPPGELGHDPGVGEAQPVLHGLAHLALREA